MQLVERNLILGGNMKENVKMINNNEESPKNIRRGYVNVPFLNRRKSPSIKSDLYDFTPLSEGTEVVILNEHKEWYEIETPYNDTCFVMSKGITIR